jgi:hypothetical protein
VFIRGQNSLADVVNDRGGFAPLFPSRYLKGACLTNRHNRWTLIFVGILSGSLLTMFLLYVSFIFSIHGDFSFAGLVFPFAVTLSPSLGEITGLSFLLAIIQWPFYGSCLAVAWRAKRREIFITCLLALTVLHFAAMIVAIQYVSSAPLTR